MPAAAKPVKISRRRARRPSLGHDEFLDKVLDIILDQGFEATSIETITADLGMAKRTFYLRFGSKAGLFDAVLQRAVEQWIVPIDRLRAAECDDLEQTLIAIARILVGNVSSPSWSRLFHLAHADTGRTSNIATRTVMRGWGRTVAYLAGLLRERLGGAERHLPDAELVAEAFLHLVLAYPSSAPAWGVRFNPDMLARRTDFNVRLFVSGLPQPPTPPAGTEAAGLAARLRELQAVLGDTAAALDRAADSIDRPL